jgi:hypothetical protein
MNRAHVAALSLALAVAVSAAGCSDDSGGATSSKSTTTSSTAGTTVTSTTTVGSSASRTGIASNTLAPVGIGEQADLGGGFFVTVTKVDPVQLKADRPGETAGPGVSVTLAFRNGSTRPVDLNGLAFNAHYGDGTPAVPTGAPVGERLSGPLAPGKAATGTYGFRVPSDKVNTIRIDIQHSGEPNVVIVDVGK